MTLPRRQRDTHGITTLEQIVKQYGPPNEKEHWTREQFKVWVGLNGTVSWWGDVGIATSSQRTITHVLVRERGNKDE